MSKPGSELDRELRALEAELKRLEAEYNMFFAGRSPKLPWEQRKRLDAMMKRFDRMHIQNTGDRFRFQTIQSRWAAFGELWERQLKAQEQGRVPVRGRRGIAGQAGSPARRQEKTDEAPSATPVKASSKDADKGAPPSPPREAVVAAARVSDPAKQEDRVKDLYEQLAAARRDTGEKPIEYDRFAALVRAQVDKHGAGGREVAFRVDVKDGKVKLSAKAAEDS